MSALRELQTRFIDYLTTDADEVEIDVSADSAGERKTRLNIYKNAYRIRLRQVIETDHDILWTYLGDELFEQLVNGYIDNHPSSFTSLRYFCDALPDYLASTPPFEQHPIIAEIATFERRLMDAFDAAESDRAGLPDLQAVNPEDWPTLRLRLHPSVQLLHTEWNSVESWKALKDEVAPPDASNATSQYWILWRGRDRLSQFRPLEQDEQTLLAQVVAGDEFSTLCETLLQWYPENEVSVISLRYITDWLEQGLIARLETGAGGKVKGH